MQMSPDESRTVKKNQRPSKRPAQEILESHEYLAIKSSVPCKRNYDGRPIGPSPSSARPLHMVGASWWHVSEHDSVQSSNVDAKFHRRRR
jgi:hypothetical protein